jgi:hypothetical protein
MIIKSQFYMTDNQTAFVDRGVLMVERVTHTDFEKISVGGEAAGSGRT